MDQVWLSAPAPAIKVWRESGQARWLANAALRGLADARAADEAQWPALAGSLLALCEAPDGAPGLPDLFIGGTPCRPLPVACAPGWLVWLEAAAPRAPNSHLGAHGAFNAALSQWVSMAGVSVWRLDMATRRIQLNDVGYEAVNLEPRPEGVDIEAFRRTVHPDDLEAVEQAARDAAASDRIVDVVTRYRSRDGSYRHWITRRVAERDAQGRVVALAGVSIDQTERIMERERAQALAQRISFITETAGIGTWERDVVRGVSRWNAQMYRLRGLEPVEGATPEALRTGARHPEDGPNFDERMRRAVEEGHAFEEELRVVWPDGSTHWIASRAIPQPGPSGRMERLLGVNWDITERKRAEQALRDKAAAEQASRAKSEFLSRMSHELRTPLNAVLGFAQLLSQDTAEPLTPRQAERVERVHSAGLHLLALIDDVLDLATVESASLSLAREAVPLRAAIDDALQWTQPQAGRAGIALRAERVDGWVRADARRLRQILSNLLSNAVKYNRAGGEVRLSAVPCRLHGEPGWQVRVRDTGRGLTPAQRAHLFEPFNRLGAERDGIEGTGIGLAIVRHLLGAMGGSIEVESVPGEGSEFRFTLPAAQPPAGEAQAPDGAVDAPPAHAPATGLRLLYIEDNPVNVLLVQELVAMRRNVSLLTAANGESGVALACAERPDVVLVDMQLPDFDGFEVLRRLRAANGDAGRVFIALSANAMPEDVSRARAAGFHDYWTKPIDFAQFLARLDALAAPAG